MPPTRTNRYRAPGQQPFGGGQGDSRYFRLMDFSRWLYGTTRRTDLYHQIEHTLLGEIETDITGTGYATDIAEADPEVITWKIQDIYEDLLNLAELLDRAVTLVGGRLEDQVVLERIAHLRNTTGRTPPEAATALRLADRLERKLRNRLEPGQDTP